MKVLCGATLAFAISCGGPAPTPTSRPAKAADPPVGKLQAPRARFPPTHAGKTLGAWFDAFNSGDAARIREFAATYKYPAPDELVALREQTGGFELMGLEMKWDLEAQIVVKEKKSATQVVGWLRVKDADPAVIEMFELEAVPPGMTAEQMTIAIYAATRARVRNAGCWAATRAPVVPYDRSGDDVTPAVLIAKSKSSISRAFAPRQNRMVNLAAVFDH